MKTIIKGKQPETSGTMRYGVLYLARFSNGSSLLVTRTGWTGKDATGFRRCKLTVFGNPDSIRREYPLKSPDDDFSTYDVRGSVNVLGVGRILDVRPVLAVEVSV